MATSALSKFWSNKWENRQLCDVVIKTKHHDEDKSIPCHSFILAPASSQLEQLSSSDDLAPLQSVGLGLSIERSDENGKIIITHPLINFDEWQIFLTFLYYGKVSFQKLQLTLDENLDLGRFLCSAANKLAVHDSLHQAIDDYLKQESSINQQQNFISTEKFQVADDKLGESATMRASGSHFQQESTTSGDLKADVSLHIKSEGAQRCAQMNTRELVSSDAAVELICGNKVRSAPEEFDNATIPGKIVLDGQGGELDLVCVHCWYTDRGCTRGRMYRCFLCCQDVAKDQLTEHFQLHPERSEIGYFSCGGGTLKFSGSAVGDTRHVTVKNTTHFAFEFSCRACDYSCAVLYQFSQHLSDQHGVHITTSNYVPRCRHCLRFFSTHMVKDDHEFYCLGNGFPFCEKCGERFTSPTQLKRHMHALHPVRAKRNRVEAMDTDETHSNAAAGDSITSDEREENTDVTAQDVSDTESQQADATNVCLWCWHNDAACSSDRLVCFVCFEIVHVNELKSHTLVAHPQLTTGYYSCLDGKLQAKVYSQCVIGMRVNMDGKKAHSCTLCSFVSPSLSQLHNHIRRKHIINRSKQTIDGIFSCENCALYFSKKHWLINHQHFCHGKHLPMCEQCDMKLPSPVALNRHLWETHGVSTNAGLNLSDAHSASQGTSEEPVHCAPDASDAENRNDDDYIYLAPADDCNDYNILHISIEQQGARNASTISIEQLGARNASTISIEQQGARNASTISIEQQEARNASAISIERQTVRNSARSTTVGPQGETEGTRTDRNAVCLWCWKENRYCRGVETLRCLLCLQAIRHNKLDEHAQEQHPQLEFGAYSCQGKTLVLPPKFGGILGKRTVSGEGQNILEEFECQVCKAKFLTPKFLKEHLVRAHAVKGTDKGISQIGVCWHCRCFFINMSQVEDHQYFCTGSVGLDKLPECSDCNVRFSSPCIFKRHMKLVHDAITRKTNLDFYCDSLDADVTQNARPYNFSNTSGEPNVEFDRPDRKSLCLHCWKKNSLCAGNEFLKCFMCFETVHQAALDEHAETHTGKNSGVYSCMGIHNTKFVDSNTLFGVIGQKVASGADKKLDLFKCYLCPFESKNPNAFKLHLGSAHEVKVSKSNFVPRCKYCLLYFAANSQQEDHEYFCRGADLPYCPECDLKFASPNAWRRHINEAHAGKYGPRKMFPNSVRNRSLLCNSCGITFKNQAALKYHERKMHSGTSGSTNNVVSEADADNMKGKHVCQFCGASFLRQYTLTEHVNYRHTKSKFHECKYCGRMFLRRSELARHLLNHRRGSPILCSMCKFQGFSKYELKRHFLKDHRIGQFKCTCCTAKFTDYEEYEEHKYKKLCPRYHQPGKQLIVNSGPNATVASLIGEDGESNIYSWINANGDIVRAYINKQDLVNIGGKTESLQLVEMPDGQIQIGLQSEASNAMDVAQADAVHAADIESGTVQLLKINSTSSDCSRAVDQEAVDQEAVYQEAVDQKGVTVKQEVVDQKAVYQEAVKQEVDDQNGVVSVQKQVEYGNGGDDVNAHSNSSSQNSVKLVIAEEDHGQTEQLFYHSSNSEFNTLQKLGVSNSDKVATVPADLNLVTGQHDDEQATTAQVGSVTEMSLEDFQQLYGSSALDAIETEETENGKCFVVYVEDDAI